MASVVARVVSHGAEGAVPDHVVRDDHPAGAKQADAVAVLAGAAGARRDSADAVGGDERPVVALAGAPDLDAIVGASLDRIRSYGRWRAIRSVRVRVAEPRTLEAPHVG